MITSGNPDETVKMGPPQRGQNPRPTVLPLSAVTSWTLVSPVIATPSLGTAKIELCPPPPLFWQSVHWQ
jgi:hypothetical protein